LVGERGTRGKNGRNLKAGGSGYKRQGVGAQEGRDGRVTGPKRRRSGALESLKEPVGEEPRPSRTRGRKRGSLKY